VPSRSNRVSRDAGFPDGLFRAVFPSNEARGRRHRRPGLRAGDVTGSDRAGSQVAEQAARNLKKTVLELGGSDPFIGHEDPDLEAGREHSGGSGLINSARVASPPSASLWWSAWRSGFLERFTATCAPGGWRSLDPATQVGPQARPRSARESPSAVARVGERGARTRLGCEVPAGRGPSTPTVLSAVEPGMPAFDQETSAPWAAVIAVRTRRTRSARERVALRTRGVCLTATRSAGARRARDRTGSVFVNGLVRPIRGCPSAA